MQEVRSSPALPRFNLVGRIVSLQIKDEILGESLAIQELSSADIDNIVKKVNEVGTRCSYEIVFFRDEDEKIGVYRPYEISIPFRTELDIIRSSSPFEGETVDTYQCFRLQQVENLPLHTQVDISFFHELDLSGITVRGALSLLSEKTQNEHLDNEEKILAREIYDMLQDVKNTDHMLRHVGPNFDIVNAENPEYIISQIYDVLQNEEQSLNLSEEKQSLETRERHEPSEKLTIIPIGGLSSWGNDEEKNEFAHQIIRGTIGHLWKAETHIEGVSFRCEDREIFDYGDAIEIRSDDPITIRGALRLAAEKGWSHFELEGSASLQVAAAVKAKDLDLNIENLSVTSEQIEHYQLQKNEQKRGLSW